jgi:predicted metalloprotease with PDZ domain
MGLLLDFQIRDATQNQHTLDDVMRLLYRKHYKELQRGFAEAEFYLACESVAGDFVGKGPSPHYIFSVPSRSLEPC